MSSGENRQSSLPLGGSKLDMYIEDEKWCDASTSKWILQSWFISKRMAWDFLKDIPVRSYQSWESWVQILHSITIRSTPLYHRICFFSENVQSFIFEVVFLPGWCFSIGLRISTLHSWMRIFKPHRISPALRFGPSANTPSQSATASASRPLGPFFQPLKGVAYIHPNKTTAKKFWMLQKLHLLLQLFFLPLQLCLCTIQL